ncbi:MAG TPA: arginine--tRNA ligase [Solirubrobacteraceae bacterium]|nr:arginine--tRNA ligase [Solirubrobacteraceae bacterium]
MTTNLFDYFEELAAADAHGSPWAARAPRRPQRGYDLKLVPRSPGWREDPESLGALERIEREPWVRSVLRRQDEVRLLVDDGWIETAGAALEAGGSAEGALADLAQGRRYSVQFWDANATKALHVGHLRNLAIGNALAAALAQAGGRVERRSLISDAGRSMGEAMAGIVKSGRHTQSWPDGSQKSDHFVGVCYADYVADGALLSNGEPEQPEDSLTRELELRGDTADDLLKRVMGGDPEALELWFKTRAWVIAGQRKTLARLGVAFDRVFFESDFLPDAAQLTTAGLREGRLQRREDGVVIYRTGVEDLEEMPLVRADGVPTQHMRAVSYWMSAPDMEHVTTLQICGTEWVSHAACIRKLMSELTPDGNGGVHPTRDIFHGMVSRQKRAVASSADGALLIDDLIEWLEREIGADSARHAVRRAHPAPELIPAQVVLGYFLPYPIAPRVDFDPDRLLRDGESVGWDLVRARARRGGLDAPGGHSPAADPDYRFAVLQSELYRRYLRLTVERLDVRPLAHYLRHLAAWYLERERSGHVERVVHTLCDRGAHGLGLEAGR